MVWPIFGDHQLKRSTIERMMSSGDDLTTAVLGGTLLEEATARTLKERMRDDKNGTKRLFDLEKPLANVAAQIDVLYMLWAIDKTTRDTMLGIARVRNFFAHNMDAKFDSEHKELTNASAKMTLHEMEFYPDARFGIPTSKKIEEAINNRERFIVNLKLCLNMLMQDRCRHEAHSTELVSHETLQGELGKPHP